MSRSKQNRDTTAFIYLRLSREDNMEGESYSISNQKKLLERTAKEKGYTNIVPFIDDGISGVSMNRAGFNKMLEELQKNKASAVLVKDMSRLGRNYIEVGRLTEEFFPENNIRLIAVSDGIDTDEGENELAPIRNLFNEWYSRDISKKLRISNKIKGNSGIPLGQPPYGYIKDPDNPKFWIVDYEAAQVVKRIFLLTLDGLGTEQIAKLLSSESILSPCCYAETKGIKKPKKSTSNTNPYYWGKNTIMKILEQQAYCGDVINFKTYSKSYKNKKRFENAQENMAIFKDVHEPIIERAIFEKIAAQRGNTRKRQTGNGERNMFSGLLICSDCGNNLHYHFNQKNHDIKYFNCSNHKGNRGTCDKTHYVRVDFLEKVVLAEIRRLTKFASQYESEFIQAVEGYSKNAVEHDMKLKQKIIKDLQNRNNELDLMFENLYIDNISGKINDTRFAKMTNSIEQEQMELEKKIKALEFQILEIKNQSSKTDFFLSAIRKYTRVRKLTPRMLQELIDKIEVHHAEKQDGVQVQHIVIHYNCIGSIDIPSNTKIEFPEISMPIRQGVTLSYA